MSCCGGRLYFSARMFFLLGCGSERQRPATWAGRLRQESGACSPAPAWVLGSSASQFVKKRNFSPRESPVRRWHGTCRLDPASEPPATFSSPALVAQHSQG